MKAVPSLLDYVRYRSTEFPVQEDGRWRGRTAEGGVSTKFFLIFGVPLLRLRLQARLFCSVDACDVRLGKSSGNRIGTGS